MNVNDYVEVERIPVLDQNRVQYSDRYSDDKYEYRHVILPKEFARYVPKTHLLTETEWRNLGVQQSPGWEHYMLHTPEPHVLMFRRPLPSQATTGKQAVESLPVDASMHSIDGRQENEPPDSVLCGDCASALPELIDICSPNDEETRICQDSYNRRRQ